MSRARLPIEPHLPPAEVARRYRSCRDGVEKAHWHALWLLTRPDEPLTPAQATKQVGLTPSWVRTLLKRYNAEGPAGLADRRATTNGRPPKLTADQQAELFATLQPPPDGGLWSGPKGAAHVRGRWGVEVCNQTGWGWLRQLGFTLQVPRPRHPQAADPAAQRVGKRRPSRARGRVAATASRPSGRAGGRE